MRITQIAGTPIPIEGDDIDTDRIIPARFLKTTTFDGLAKGLFADERFTEKGGEKNHPLNDEKFAHASIMVVNKNFGCGSSREHAPQAIKAIGIKAIVGVSFAEIFASNCEQIGLPAVMVSEETAKNLQELAKKDAKIVYTIDLETKKLHYADSDTGMEISEGTRTNFVNGTWNILKYMHESMNEIRKVHDSLPYVNGFKH